MIYDPGRHRRPTGVVNRSPWIAATVDILPATPSREIPASPPTGVTTTSLATQAAPSESPSKPTLRDPPFATSLKQMGPVATQDNILPTTGCPATIACPASLPPQADQPSNSHAILAALTEDSIRFQNHLRTDLNANLRAAEAALQPTSINAEQGSPLLPRRSSTVAASQDGAHQQAGVAARLSLGSAPSPSQAPPGTDTTEYGSARSATRSFYTHHLRLVSLAIAIGVAKQIDVWAAKMTLGPIDSSPPPVSDDSSSSDDDDPPTGPGA
jgi:hypothetical protein